MERRSFLHYEHSEQEEDEDQLKRISMCFNIDILQRLQNQERNYFNRISSSERKPRYTGGGLFGTVKDSSMSFTVPNKFFAASRYGYDRHNRRCYKPRRKAIANYEEHGYNAGGHESIWPNEYYETEHPRESRYKREKRRQPKSPHREYYDDQDERDYNEYSERHQREPSPDFDYDNTEYYRTRNKRSKRRNEQQQQQDNEHFYNSFYNCETPSLFNEAPASQYSDYVGSRFKRKSRKDYRPYETMDYRPINYQQQQDHYIEPINYAQNYETDYDENYEKPVNQIESNYYPKPKKRIYDYDYYEDPQQQGHKPVPKSKKSVDFLGLDCEIPYSILKKYRNGKLVASHNYNMGTSLIEIPYKRKPHRFFINEQLYEPTPKRSDSGCDLQSNRGLNIPCMPYYYHTCNPITRRNCGQSAELNEPKLKCRSLKKKISGFFKRSKSKSRTKCSYNPPMAQFGSNKYRSSVCTMKPRYNTGGSVMDTAQSASSMSCVAAKSTVCPIPKKSVSCCTTKKLPKCSAYPTNYRDKCGGQCLRRENDLSRYSMSISQLSKVNSTENFGICNCCSEYSRNDTQDSSVCDQPGEEGDSGSQQTLPETNNRFVSKPIVRDSDCYASSQDKGAAANSLGFEEESSACSSVLEKGQIHSFPVRAPDIVTSISSPENITVNTATDVSAASASASAAAATAAPGSQEIAATSSTISDQPETTEANPLGCTAVIQSSPNPMQPSTINICLTICTTDGKLMQPTAILEPQMKPGSPIASRADETKKSVEEETLNRIKSLSLCSGNDSARSSVKEPSFSSKDGSESKALIHACDSDILRRAKPRVTIREAPVDREERVSVCTENDYCNVRAAAQAGGAEKSERKAHEDNNYGREISKPTGCCKKGKAVCSCQKDDNSLTTTADSSQTVEETGSDKRKTDASTNCHCPAESFVENLKRELLESLRNEQQKCEEFSYPTRSAPHVMFYPCPPNRQCPCTLRPCTTNGRPCPCTMQNESYDLDPYKKCWAPL